MAVDGIFFDEKRMLGLGWPLDVVEAIKRVFEADAVTLSIKVSANEIAIAQLDLDVAANTLSIATNTSDISTLQTVVTNKVDKVGSATLDNIATLLANGNIADSGVKVSDLTVIIGTGAPNGVVTSNQSRLYIDDAVPTQYFNANVGVNTGWVAL